MENGPPPLIADAVEYPRPESLHTQGRWAMCAGSGDRVMRKLLHAIYGMLKTDTDFDGEKFRRSVPTAA